MSHAPVRGLRRSLVLVLAFFMALSLAAPAVAQQRGRPVPDSRIGVQLWTVRDVLYGQGVEATLQAVADAGYKNIEPFDLAGESAEQWREWMDELGLRAPSIHRGIDLLENDLDQVIADAKTLGAKYVTLNWVAPEWRTEEGVEEMAAILNEAGRELRRNGLRLAYHNHDFEFTTVFDDGDTMFERLAELTDPRLVDFQLDLYWVNAGGEDVVDVINEYKRRIATVHVKDTAEDGSFADVGEGVTDWAEIFSTMPFRYYFVENDQPDDSIDSINDSYRYLSNFRYVPGQSRRP